MFTVNADYAIEQPLSQYFASRMINYEWLQHDGGSHTMFPSSGTYNDGAGHILVTSYTVQRPDGTWSVMLVNRDQHNAHRVGIVFKTSATEVGENYFSGTVDAAYFGPEQYKWHPAEQICRSVAFSVGTEESRLQQYKPGYAEPDGCWTDQGIRAAGR